MEEEAIDVEGAETNAEGGRTKVERAKTKAANGHRGRSGPWRIERSAGGVVVRPLAGIWHALLIRDPYGNWSLPKGHIEGGESLRETAAREVEEETGISPDVVGPKIGTIDWTFRQGRDTIHKFCTFFLMRSRAGEPVPQQAEGITACAWIPLHDAAGRIRYADTRKVVQRAGALITEAGW